jgi:hypothetical protein
MAISIIGDIIKEIRGLINDNSTGEARATSKEVTNLIAGRQVFRLDASIARQARRNTAVFPILAVDSVEPEQLFKLQKRLEANIASMLLLCVQNGNDMIDMTTPDGKRQFIDMYTGGGQGLMEDGIPGLSGVVGSEGSNPLLNPRNFQKAAKAAFDVLNNDFENDLDMSLISYPKLGWYDDASNLGSNGVGTVAPVSSPAPAGGVTTWNPQDEEAEDSDSPSADDFMEIGSEAYGGRRALGNEERKEAANRRKEARRSTVDDVEEDREAKDKENKARSEGWEKEMGKIQKKGDDSEPTVVSVEVLLKDEHGYAGKTNMAFGVKTTLHMFQASEMAEAIKDTYSESSLLIRLIRWRAGELSFIKDVLLNMKEIKQTVSAKLNRRNQTGPKAIFASMRFKIKNAVMSSAAATKDGKLLPTAILCVTMDEVEEVRRTCGKDFFKKMKDARELCEKLGLFGIVIVESASNSYYSFFDDGAVSYTKNTLKKESKNDDEGILRAVFGALKR